MEGKHTPGPWQAVYDNEYARFGFGVKIISNNSTICDLSDRQDYYKMVDAELIASAPALLEQVEKLKSENERLRRAYDYILSSRNSVCDELRNLTFEVERLKAREKELIEVVEQFVKNIAHVDDSYVYLKVKLKEQAQSVLSRIKQTT